MKLSEKKIEDNFARGHAIGEVVTRDCPYSALNERVCGDNVDSENSDGERAL